MSTTPGSVRLLRCAPYFPVPDVQKAARYYESVLGFKAEYAAGDPPQFAIVSRDGLGLMLKRVPDASRIVPNEAQGGTWDAFFWVNDADALCAELKAHSAQIVYGPIIQTEYHMKEFAVRDLDGYVLGFGQDWHE
jgi:catechol 2,3-dioxygenase-like lactoylglutathione lyase family enzyme